MTRKVVRDDPDEKMGRDVLARDRFGATSPGTRMVLCWLVLRMYKPKSETKPIQYMSCLASKSKIPFQFRTVAVSSRKVSYREVSSRLKYDKYIYILQYKLSFHHSMLSSCVTLENLIISQPLYGSNTYMI